MTSYLTRKENRILLITLLCGLFMICAMAMSTAPVHADGGTITIKYPAAAEAGIQADFRLYKVGHFDGNELIWDDGIPDIGINVSESEFTDDEGNVDMDAWAAALAEAAKTLADDIEGPDSKVQVDKIVSGKTNAEGIATATVPANGLYLVVGSRQTVTKDGVTTGITPVPGFVTIFQGTAQVEIKATEDKAKQLMVRKFWPADLSGAEKAREEALRPEGIQVKICSRTSASAEYEVDQTVNNGDPVTLNKDNDWAYQWTTTDIQKEWMCEEIMPEDAQKYYTQTHEETISQDGNTILFNITNTFGSRTLELTKNLDGFVDHGQGGSTTIVFKVEGYIGDEVVYEAKPAIEFNAADRKATTVTGIPMNLTKLVVSEVYTANYTKQDPQEAQLTMSPDGKDGVYKVTFDNPWDKTVDYDSGIINQYGLSDDSNLDKGFEILKRLGLRD